VRQQRDLATIRERSVIVKLMRPNAPESGPALTYEEKSVTRTAPFRFGLATCDAYETHSVPCRRAARQTRATFARSLRCCVLGM
jgi:hypothetical protein